MEFEKDTKIVNYLLQMGTIIITRIKSITSNKFMSERKNEGVILLKRFLAILAVASISNCLWIEKPAYARPAFPISEISFEDRTDLGDGDVYLKATLTVPDKNTTRNVAGRLRRYDLHIAKMFEVTDYQCRNWQNSPIPYEGEKGIVWVYSAGDGNKWMGIFTIDCEKARNVMNSFTLGGERKHKDILL
ncbi:hypothetical protein CAL7716_103060 (plasmid) [Calothrix sp. PCC 7716]|nr:hypothetical protein CAL7716_103060 [Calothrix sp. PCC 7716]